MPDLCTARFVTVLQIGSTLAGYRIERVIGTGHVGTVYLARSPDLPRYEALKVADRDMMDDAELRDRFVREADVGARLNHPNIVAIHRRGTDDGLLWIAMQYVEGTDASAALRQGRISAERAIHIISAIALAIDYAHSYQVIHRDIKPANFLLSDDGRVLLGDFGTAHIIGEPEPTTGSVVATLPYAAPEVLSGRPVDGRADIYSLGCSLFRLLTGSAPFSGDGDTAAVIARHLHDPPPRVSDSVPGLSAAMDAVIARALAKDPRDRFDSGQSLALAAAAALQLPTATTPVQEVAHSPTAEPHVEPPSSPRQRWVQDSGRPSPPEPAPGRAAAASTIAGSRVTDLIGGLSSRWRSHERGRMIWVAGAAVAGVAIAVTSLVWLTSSPGNDSAGGGSPPPETTTRMVPAQGSPSTPPRSPDAEARLVRALPPGYPPDSCKPVTPSDGAQAALRCSVTLAPGAGSATVTHELLPSSVALDTAFTAILDDSKVFVCPGNIASPGAWRRNATPEVVSGTLACGVHQGAPIVAWTTTDNALFVSVVQGATAGVTVEELFAWWSLHS